MKKIILILAVIMTVFVANAGQNISKEEARIYINPGHGSWGSGDRNMTTINHASGDTTGFWESNTNLWKGLKLYYTLIKWGVPAEHICMSRVRNGDAENRNLTEIAQEANSFNSDYFLSIHSDAGENHTLIIHKGYSVPADDPYMIHGDKYTAKELMQICSDMAYTAWPFITSNGIDVMGSAVMQSGKPYIRGDFTFYYGWTNPSQNTGKSGYLGVLRTNTCPGFLSEGFAHEYMPATHRALNPDYCGQEGVRYARAMAEWFGWEKEKTGYIMGSVKDRHHALIHKLYNYTPNSIDGNAPINNAVVTLYKGGVEVAKYTCDDEWNGVFVFENLEPGNDYTIDATAAGYKTAFALDAEYAREHAQIEVKANETTYPIIYLEEEGYVAPETYNYPQPDQDKFLLLAGKYEMKQDFIDKSLSVLDGKTIRREIAHGDSLYVLALEADNTPHIYCLNMKTQELYFELNTEGVGTAGDTNEVLPISDIAFTSDSILVACNKVKTNFYLEAGTFYVYAWEKDLDTRSPKGSPKVWFTSKATQTSGNFTNAITGETFAVSGSYEDCKVITTAENVNTPGKIRFPFFDITRKGLTASYYNKYDPLTKETAGDNYKMCVSPYNDEAVIVDGSKMTPTEYVLTTETNVCTLGTELSSDVMSAEVGGASYFKYGKSICMVIPKTDAEGKNVGVELYDVTAGLDKATLIETTNTDIAAGDGTWLIATSHVEGADITLYLNRNNTVSRFTTQEVEQTYYKSVYAYNLDVTADNDNYKFTFSVNDNCELGGKLKFYDSATGVTVGEIALDNVVAGANEKIVSATELPGTAGQELKWAVEVGTHKVTTILPLVPVDDNYLLKRGFATVDNSPKSEHFGRIYVSDRVGTNKTANGVIVFDQNYTRLNTSAYNGGVTFGTNSGIVTDERGNVYVTDENTSKSGLWLANPNELETSFFQFFYGERNSSGVFYQNGVETGGVTTSASFYGSGVNAKLYVYQKNAAGKYVVNVYNTGKEDGSLQTYWATAPSKTFELPDEMSSDASIVAVEQGIWVCQTRGISDDTENAPALMFIDNDGNITFNHGGADKGLLEGISGSALAVSRDEKLLVTNDMNGILQFFNIEWNETTPILRYAYSYEHGLGIDSRRSKSGNYIEQMAFDYAGNLVISGYYLGVFTIPTENNVCETPARKTVTCGQASVAIENVEVDGNEPVEYYNLQGMRVANPENGIFIKKQGSKATKVVL